MVVRKGWAVTGAGSGLEPGSIGGKADRLTKQNLDTTHWHDVVAVLACPPGSSSCLEAPLGGLNGTGVPVPKACGPGYASRLCASCELSHRRTSTDKCTKCNNTEMAAGVGAALSCLVVLLVVAVGVRRSKALTARVARFRTRASLVWGLGWQSIRIDVSLLQVGRTPWPGHGRPPAPGPSM